MTNLSAIFGLFDAAATSLRYPKIHLRAHDGTIVVIKRNGSRSRWMGQLCITNDAAYGSPRAQYFGRVTQSGQFVEGTRNAAVQSLLQDLAANPVAVASAYGALTGSCCFCQTALTDPQSTSVGYGPVCADHWGLPWGSKAHRASSKPVAPVSPEPTPDLPAAASHVEEDVDAYDALIARLDATTLQTRIGAAVLASLRMDVILADVAEVGKLIAADEAQDAELNAIHPESLAEAQARTLATVDAPAVPEETRTMAVPLTSVRVAAVAMPALNITVPTAEVTKQSAPVVTDVRVLNLDVLREELRKVRQQYRRPSAQ